MDIWQWVEREVRTFWHVVLRGSGQNVLNMLSLCRISEYINMWGFWEKRERGDEWKRSCDISSAKITDAMSKIVSTEKMCLIRIISIPQPSGVSFDKSRLISLYAAIDI